MKKKEFKAKKTNKEDIQALRDHLKMIDEATTAICEKYRKYWDKEKHTWKDDFDGH